MILVVAKSRKLYKDFPLKFTNNHCFSLLFTHLTCQNEEFIIYKKKDYNHRNLYGLIQNMQTQH